MALGPGRPAVFVRLVALTLAPLLALAAFAAFDAFGVLGHGRLRIATAWSAGTGGACCWWRAQECLPRCHDRVDVTRAVSRLRSTRLPDLPSLSLS